MNRREVAVASYAEAAGEIARLREGGYEALGRWGLGQICEHLAYYYRGSLEGFGFKMPWLVRKLMGGPLLGRILRTGAMKAGWPTVKQSVPRPDTDEGQAVDSAVGWLDRLRHHTAELHPSPLFGQMTPDEWRRLHLIHTAHHLSFLVPRGMEPAETPPNLGLTGA